MNVYKKTFPARLLMLVLLCFPFFALDVHGQSSENILDKIHYRNIGPTKQGGRFMTFGVPDLNKQPYTFYAAGSTGGLWKTTDNGITYTPLFQNESVSAIGDVDVSYSDPNIVWVGTGNLSYWGEGVYKSSDGGHSWTHMGLENSLAVMRIEIHPEDPDIVYVAFIPPTAGEESACHPTTP